MPCRFPRAPARLLQPWPRGNLMEMRAGSSGPSTDPKARPPEPRTQAAKATRCPASHGPVPGPCSAEVGPWSPSPQPPQPIHSPGQGGPWQALVSRPLPLQPRPPICGTGELQRRMRVMLPTPQVTEQEDQGDQWLQPPSCRTSTEETKTRVARAPGGSWGLVHPGFANPSGRGTRLRASQNGRWQAVSEPQTRGLSPGPHPRDPTPRPHTHCGGRTCPGCTPASGWTAPGRCCWSRRRTAPSAGCRAHRWQSTPSTPPTGTSPPRRPLREQAPVRPPQGQPTRESPALGSMQDARTGAGVSRHGSCPRSVPGRGSGPPAQERVCDFSNGFTKDRADPACARLHWSCPGGSNFHFNLHLLIYKRP